MKEERVVQNTEKLSKNLNIDFKCNVWHSVPPKNICQILLTSSKTFKAGGKIICK